MGGWNDPHRLMEPTELEQCGVMRIKEHRAIRVIWGWIMEVFEDRQKTRISYNGCSSPDAFLQNGPCLRVWFSRKFNMGQRFPSSYVCFL